MTYRRGPEYQPTIGAGTRFAVVAGLAFTAACRAEIQATPTAEVFLTQPRVTEVIPTPTPADLTIPGIAQDRNEIQAAFGVAVGAGGPGLNRLEKVFNSVNIQSSLNNISLAPVVDSERGIAQVGFTGDQRVCFPNMPEVLFNPNVESGQDDWLAANGFIVSYGDGLTQDVRFQGLGAISLKNTNEDLICVNAVINNVNNPFRDNQNNVERSGKLLNILMDRNTGEIYGTLPGIYSADQDVRFDFSTGQVVIGNSNVWYIGDGMAELTSLPTFSSEINELQEALRLQGIETEFTENQQGDYVLNQIDGSSITEIVEIEQRGDEYLLSFVDSSDKTASFPLEQFVIDPNTRRLSAIGENGVVFYTYYSEISRWQQLRELPYLSVGDDQLSINFGDSWKRPDAHGVRSLTINNSIPTRPFRDPETGENVSLRPLERLKMASEIAQVVAAQAWDPNYSFSDLREGKPYSIMTLDGSMHTVNPNAGVSYHITDTQPPAGSYGYRNIAQSVNYWWEVNNDGALSAFAAIKATDQFWRWGGDFDILYLKANLTMMLYQQVESGVRKVPYPNIDHIPNYYRDYQWLLENPEDANLMADLVHEMDPEKLADELLTKRSGKEHSFLYGSENSLFYATMGHSQ